MGCLGGGLSTWRFKRKQPYRYIMASQNVGLSAGFPRNTQQDRPSHAEGALVWSDLALCFDQLLQEFCVFLLLVTFLYLFPPPYFSLFCFLLGRMKHTSEPPPPPPSNKYSECLDMINVLLSPRVQLVEALVVGSELNASWGQTSLFCRVCPHEMCWVGYRSHCVQVYWGERLT